MAAAGLALLAAGCGETAGGPGADGEPIRDGDGGAWRPVAQSPLTPREAPLTVAVGGRILVAGGSDGPPCPPNADCVAPPPPLRDGALYDPAADAWTPIADAPAPVGGGVDTSVVIGDTVYVTTVIFDEDGTTTTFQSYDAAADAWAELTPPDDSEFRALTAVGGRVVAYRGSHEDYDGGTLAPLDPLPPDLGYDPATDTWAPLPADPLGPSYDRRLVGIGGGETNPWGREIPYGGVLDPATGTWSTLPERAHRDPLDGFMIPVGDLTGERTIVSGAWALDVPTGTWARLPDLPVEGHVQGRSAAFADTPDGGLVLLWGGSHWPDADAMGMGDVGDGELIADGWVWTIPAPD
ncbi:Kelch motif-containing protein [Jiangella alba]|uniref:Kelch motif-containing protein n=1 Tax=Jiangella alba TaxID=561176 RepID=A0A1H5HSR7_9ACTN|nr:Kelch motif-containing protein [Jiangella alba]